MEALDEDKVETAALLLADGKSVEETALTVGCSEKTIARLVRKADFSARLAKHRRLIFSSTFSGIIRAANKAVKRLETILEDNEVDPEVHVKAAEKVLGSLMKTHEICVGLIDANDLSDDGQIIEGENVIDLKSVSPAELKERWQERQRQQNG